MKNVPTLKKFLIFVKSLPPKLGVSFFLYYIWDTGKGNERKKEEMNERWVKEPGG